MEPLRSLLEEKRLYATAIQFMLGVEDKVVICYGFGNISTLEDNDNTFIVWFDEGKLHRVAQNKEGTVVQYWTCDFFEPKFFMHEVTRWYEEYTTRMLRWLFYTFGNPLPEIIGGKTLDRLPDTSQFQPHDWM